MNKKILIAGASGYGNIGDDAYKVMFGNALKDYDVKFDSPYPDANVMYDFDALILGGGGIIYCNHTNHFDYMKQYLDAAVEKNKPYAFISCGVQVADTNSKMSIKEIVEKGVEQLEPWKKYLIGAKVITVRSKRCKQIIDKVTKGKARCFYVPDYCYALGLYAENYSVVPDDSYIFIPTPTSVKTEEFYAQWLDHGGSKAYVLAFSRDDYTTVYKLGQEISPFGNVHDKIHLNPREAVAALAKARKVITGRYHGAVLARAIGVPEEKIVVVDGRYKSRVEEIPESPLKALDNTKYMQEYLLNIL